MCDIWGSMLLFKHCNPWKHGINLIGNENMRLKKTHSPSLLENENEERVWKNSTYENLSRGRGVSSKGKYLLSFKLSDTTWPLIRKGWVKGSLINIFKWGALNVMDISRVMPRTSEASGTRVLGFFFCHISCRNPDIGLSLKVFPGLMLESKSPLPLTCSLLSL